MRRPTAVSLQALDYVAGVVLLAAGVAGTATATDPPGPLWLNHLATVIPATGVALRRRWPMASYATVFTALPIASIWLLGPDDLPSGMLAIVLLPYALGAWTDRRAWWLALAFAAVCVVNLSGETVVFGDYVFPSAFVAASYVAGRSVRTRTRLTAELHEAAVLAEEAHTRETERALAEERRRIAREMHDVVAHSVSVMVVQAGGARRILEREPDRAAEAAAQIERIGRETLGEMRRLLGLFQGEAPDAVREPQPGLAGLEALVARARAAGLPVELAVHGDRRALPAGLDLTAYRIVQEALTNALKHGGGAATEVSVRYGADDLALRVTQAPPPRGTGPALPGGGHGLVGMRERARAFGGTVHAGAAPGGGFEVRASLPVVGEEERAGHALPAEALA